MSQGGSDARNSFSHQLPQMRICGERPEHGWTDGKGLLQDVRL
jgi:hypothetical protein